MFSGTSVVLDRSSDHVDMGNNVDHGSKFETLDSPDGPVAFVFFDIVDAQY